VCISSASACNSQSLHTRGAFSLPKFPRAGSGLFKVCSQLETLRRLSPTWRHCRWNSSSARTQRKSLVCISSACLPYQSLSACSTRRSSAIVEAVIPMATKTYRYQHHRTFPYYKVQWWDAISLCWRPIQKAHPTETAARASFLPDKQCRVMEVREDGRSPIG